MRNRVAAWLRKLATRLDGERYVHAPNGTLSVMISTDAPVMISTVGGGGSGGRFAVQRPPLRVTPRRKPADCECDYWPGITGSNGVITQHAVGCPQRPDTVLKHTPTLDPRLETHTGRFTVSKSNLEDAGPCKCRTGYVCPLHKPFEYGPGNPPAEDA